MLMQPHHQEAIEVLRQDSASIDSAAALRDRIDKAIALLTDDPVDLQAKSALTEQKEMLSDDMPKSDVPVKVLAAVWLLSGIVKDSQAVSPDDEE